MKRKMRKKKTLNSVSHNWTSENKASSLTLANGGVKLQNNCSVLGNDVSVNRWFTHAQPAASYYTITPTKRQARCIRAAVVVCCHLSKKPSYTGHKVVPHFLVRHLYSKKRRRKQRSEKQEGRNKSEQQLKNIRVNKNTEQEHEHGTRTGTQNNNTEQEQRLK